MVQVPTVPGSPGTGNVTTKPGQVRYFRVPPGTTRTTYNLRSTPLNNATTATTATATTAVAPVAVGRGGGSPQMVQVKQEPAPPGNVATP